MKHILHDTGLPKDTWSFHLRHCRLWISSLNRSSRKWRSPEQSDTELRYAWRRCDEPGSLTKQQHSDYRCTRAESGSTCRNVCASRPSHKASFAASDATTYSALVVEVAVHSWSFDFQEIAPLPKLKQYLVVDLRLSTQPAKSGSV